MTRLLILERWTEISLHVIIQFEMEKLLLWPQIETVANMSITINQTNRIFLFFQLRNL